MKFLYHSILHSVLIVVAPFVFLRCLWDQRFRQDLFSRFRGGKEIHPPLGSIWIHASSVGEVRASSILWSSLKQEGHTTIISSFTATGYNLARKGHMDPVFRLPPDSPFWIRPLLRRWQPAALVLMEAELWPTLLWECQRMEIPVILVNGRVSQKSIDRYKRFSGFFRTIAQAVQMFSMRSEPDAERVKALGIDPEKVCVTGNIKFDAQIPENLDGKRLPQDAPMIVFGSTRPGDEGPILDAIRRLREISPELRFILAPRHIERCPEVERLIGDFSLNFVRHSEISQSGTQNHSLILVDTLGDLNGYYQQSDIAFVGGGFNPIFGGHNILEPAVHGQPVIYGKYMNNFEEEARLLSQSKGGIEIASPQELFPTLQQLLNDPRERVRRGQLAAETVLANRGAVQKNLKIIASFLPKP